MIINDKNNDISLGIVNKANIRIWNNKNNTMIITVE